ncbi:MAG: archease [Candidatus Diapherotrites archaeon]|nr:archease [Candidatus Micrarchaeota archaeon]MBU1939532.1 archease [Candidatus Micrarchaeota archaeon]
MEKYKYLEHTADALFEAYGRTEREMISNAALAMANVMYDVSKVQAKASEKVEVKGDDLEELLHNFLEEILFRISAGERLYSFFGVNSIVKSPKTREFVMQAELRGEPVDAEKHVLKTEIKAVTWNQFRVEEKEGQWVARVLVDI